MSELKTIHFEDPLFKSKLMIVHKPVIPKDPQLEITVEAVR